jgi:hypothetical protein
LIVAAWLLPKAFRALRRIFARRPGASGQRA